jgi:hypothetical protein
MRQDRGLLHPVKGNDNAPLFTSTDEQPHDLVVVYSSRDKKWDVEQYSQEQHHAFSTATSAPVDGSAQLVFIRGFISPGWVSAIGSKYNLDPDYFRRHMDFLTASIDRHAYSSPPLASALNNSFRICVNTLLHRDDFGGQDLALQRSEQSVHIGTYKSQQLGSQKVCCGDSIVREYSTVCSRFSVVEQWISLYVARTASGWTGELHLILIVVDHESLFRPSDSPSSKLLHGWTTVDRWRSLLLGHGQGMSSVKPQRSPCFNITPRWRFGPQTTDSTRMQMHRRKFSRAPPFCLCNTTL